MSDKKRGRYATEIECRELIESLPNECCLRCRFFQMFDKAVYEQCFGRPKVSGLCRRYPPMCVAEDGDTFWPLVSDTEWCGEFARTGEDRGIGHICIDPAALSEPSGDRIPLSELAKGLSEGGKTLVGWMQGDGLQYVDQIRERDLTKRKISKQVINRVRKKATEMLGRPNLSP